MIKTKLIRYRGFAVGLTMLMILSVWLLIGEGAEAYGYAGSSHTHFEKTQLKQNEIPEVYFETTGGEIIKSDENGNFNLTSLITGSFKLKDENVKKPYWKCAVKEKEGINQWTDTWVTYDGKYQGHGVKTVVAEVYNKDPIYPGAKLLRKVTINNASSNLEKLIPCIDDKEIGPGETFDMKGSEYKKVTLKGKVQGKSELVDVPAYAIRSKSTDGSYVQNNGKDIYVSLNTAKAKSAKIDMTMADNSARVSFNIVLKKVPITSFDISYPKTFYISDWNALNGNQYIGITEKKTQDQEENYWVDFNPSNADNKALTWKALTPEIAEFQPLYGNGIVPRKAGVAKFIVSSDENPELKKEVVIEFKYRYPLKSIKSDQESFELKKNEKLELPLSPSPSNATEQRIKWSYDKADIVEIENKVSRATLDETHKTKHILTAISPGTVKVTGIPEDSTAGAEKIEFTVTVKKQESTPTEDPKKTAADILSHGIKKLSKKDTFKYSDEWNVFTLSRAGHDFSKAQKKGYVSDVMQKLLDEGSLKTLSSTDLERVVLALGALGKDASNIEGLNIPEKIYNDSRIGKSTSNASIFALLALDSRNYKIPQEARWTRKALIEEILKYQKPDGGFSLSTSSANGGVDITAMALQALAPYYRNGNVLPDAVKESVDRALEFLKKKMDIRGGYSDNSCSEAQVLTALSALGIDAASADGFTKGDMNLISKLSTYKVADGFAASGEEQEANDFADVQVSYAANAYLRMKNVQPSLYDFSDSPVEKEEPGEEFDPADMYTLIDKINALPSVELPKEKEKVAEARKAFDEMLKKADDEYKDELRDVEYILSALEGKIKLYEHKDGIDFKDNDEKAGKVLSEAIDKLSSFINDGATVDEINTFVAESIKKLDELKPSAEITPGGETKPDPPVKPGENKPGSPDKSADKKSVERQKANTDNAAKAATPAKPVAPNAPDAQKTPLIIKGSKTVKLTAEQQKGMSEGRYSYMELTVKNITVKVTPEEFKSMYKANNLKTYFKVTIKSKKFIKSKALRKKIFKGKVYMLNMVISGTQMKKLNNVGIASVGKVKAKTKFRMMKLLGKKAKKAKGKKAKKAFSLLKKGGLYKASFDKKTKKVYFNTKGNLKKMYFGLVKIRSEKKVKRAR